MTMGSGTGDVSMLFGTGGPCRSAVLIPAQLLRQLITPREA
jgi:hypothetical protein